MSRLDNNIGMTNDAIWIVEDNYVLALNLQAMLEACGYKAVQDLPSGEVVLARLEKMQPDLIRMDLKLVGKLDGSNTALAIRECYVS